MDPIGLGFETFDGIGAFRTMDGTGPVDATGNIISGGPDLDGTFDGPVELRKRLADSEVVSNCMVNQWFRYSMGRMETTNDACSIQGIRQAFNAVGREHPRAARARGAEPRVPQRPPHPGELDHHGA